ncbi:Putative uncharacterized protein [Moritella viscosa]|nr:hypothetical protein [Moritella viscosa]SHO20314.1 Putative uncharacterized protein [Moritella viscosa]
MLNKIKLSSKGKCTRRCSQCEIKHEFICPVLIVFEVVLVVLIFTFAASSA